MALSMPRCMSFEARTERRYDNSRPDVRRGRWKSQPRDREHVLLRLAPLRASGGAHYTGLKEVEAGATVRAHTQQNPPGCHEGVWSNGPIGLPPYEVLRLGSPANTGGRPLARSNLENERVLPHPHVRERK